MSSALFNFTRVASRTRASIKPNSRLSSTKTGGAGGHGHGHKHKPNVPETSRPYATIAAATALSLGAYTFGSIYPPATIELLFPRIAPAPPTDPTSPESIAYTESLECELQNHPFLKDLRSSDDAKDWYEARPYQGFPEERRVNSLTAGALRGPGKLAIAPLIRAKRDESESMVIVHVGRGLCGHDGIIHGGLLATLLDETLARTAIMNLPDKVGVTAKLSLNYRAPTRADQFIVIKTSLVKAEGRKTTVKGRVEDLEGTLLVEADALFIQPKYAKLLSSAALKQAMGEQPKHDAPLHLADGPELKQHHHHHHSHPHPHQPTN